MRFVVIQEKMARSLQDRFGMITRLRLERQDGGWIWWVESCVAGNWELDPSKVGWASSRRAALAAAHKEGF